MVFHKLILSIFFLIFFQRISVFCQTNKTDAIKYQYEMYIADELKLDSGIKLSLFTGVKITSDVITNGDLYLIRSKVNGIYLFGSEKNMNKDEDETQSILIDKRNKIVYLLNEKIAYNYLPKLCIETQRPNNLYYTAKNSTDTVFLHQNNKLSSTVTPFPFYENKANNTKGIDTINSVKYNCFLKKNSINLVYDFSILQNEIKKFVKKEEFFNFPY